MNEKQTLATKDERYGLKKGEVYAVIRVSTALRKKDGSVYMTGIDNPYMTDEIQPRIKELLELQDVEIPF